MLNGLLLAVLAAVFVRDPYVGAVSAEVASGRIIASDGADNLAYPASVTKLMTAFLVLEDVSAGRYAMTDSVIATSDVNNSEASWVGLKAGDLMTIEDMLIALMVESANDVAIALGVHSAGSLEAFVARMNAQAEKLGMLQTKYYNPNGLPPSQGRYPWKHFNVTTANDQLKLALALLRQHPEILRFTSIKTCNLIKTPTGYRVGVTRRVNEPQKEAPFAASESFVKVFCNHNNVMVKDKLKIKDLAGREVVDGLKTGYINAGGSSVVMTGQQNGKRVVVVVLGSKGSKKRDEKARDFLIDAMGSLSW